MGMTFRFLATLVGNFDVDLLQGERDTIDCDDRTFFVDGGIVIDDKRFVGVFLAKASVHVEWSGDGEISPVVSRQPTAFDGETDS